MLLSLRTPPFPFVALVVLGCAQHLAGAATLTATQAEYSGYQASEYPMECIGFEYRTPPGKLHAVRLELKSTSSKPETRRFDLEEIVLVNDSGRHPAVAISWPILKRGGTGKWERAATLAYVSDCDMLITPEGGEMVVLFDHDPRGGNVQLFDLSTSIAQGCGPDRWCN